MGDDTNTFKNGSGNMNENPKLFLCNSEIYELCVGVIYKYIGDDGVGFPVDQTEFII